MAEIDEFVMERKQEFVDVVTQSEDLAALSDYFAGIAADADTVALGMLVVSDTEDAVDWFAQLAPAWTKQAEEEWKYKLANETEYHLGRFPWLDLYRALRSAVLSGDRAVIETTATAVWDLVTDPRLDEYPSQDDAVRASIVRALTALLLDRDDVAKYIEEARAKFDDTNRHQEYYGSQVAAIEAIDEDDADGTEDAVRQSLVYHDQNFTNNEDLHFIEESVATHACLFVALARQHGLDVHVDSEYVPEAIYDLA